MLEKDLGITEVRGAKANISDLVVYGDGDTFRLLCKASSKEQGWMKSTKVCNVLDGCIVQVTTQQKNPDGSYAVAEALTYVPGMHIKTDCEPRMLVPISPIIQLTEERITELHSFLAIQGLPGNWNTGDYMLGLYNGMEMMLAFVEGREPEFRSLPEVQEEKVGGTE